MGEKTANPGHFTYPAGPAAGLAVTSATGANTLTTTYVAFVTTTSAIYITGLAVEALTSTAAPTNCFVQLGTGTTGAEVIIDQEVLPISVPGAAVTATRVAAYVPIFPPVPVATSTRMVAKTADSVGNLAWIVWLNVIGQASVVDDGVAVGTVTTVTNQLTAAQIATGVWQDATAGDFTVASSIGKSQYTGNVVPGGAGGLFIAGTNAATSITTALTANITGNVTGNLSGSVGSVTGAVGSVTGAVGSVTAIVSANVTQIAGTTSKGTAGYVGVDWAQINAPTTVQGLTGTTISAAQAVASVTGAVGSVTGNVGGNVSGSVGSVTGAVGSVTGAVGSVTAAVAITSNVKKNSIYTGFMFVMTDNVNHAPAPGLTVTATRSLDGAAFASCANAVSGISNGWYSITLAATDTNANHVALMFAAPGADVTNIEINTQP